MPVTSLRDFVASELEKLPGSRTLTLHALISSPQRELELFPYSKSDRTHKINSQNILLLVADSIAPESPNPTDSTNASRVLVSALEATLYLFPGTSSSILYIGKIDTTGFSKSAPSPARTLARATINYFTRLDTRPPECGERVWVHLFARAQSQYLFPDSSVYKAKRVLGDAGLVRWWWTLLGDVARDVATAKNQPGFEGTKLWYILPGFSELEAYHTLSSGSSFKMAQSSELPWKYGHPYDDPFVTFPLLGTPLGSAPVDLKSSTESSSKAISIASLIPIFPDDPKARFMGEIASTTSEGDMPPPIPKPRSPVSPKSRNVSSSNSAASLPSALTDSPTCSPVKKRRRVDDGTPVESSPNEASSDRVDEHPNNTKENETPINTTTSSAPLPTSNDPSVIPDSEPKTENNSSATHPPKTSGPAKSTTHTESELVRRGRHALEAVSAQEFWERMGFRQECALGAVTAFFVAVFEGQGDAPKALDSKLSKDCISLPTHTRITQTLMNHAFSTPDKAIRSTQMMESTIRTLCDGASSVSEQQNEDDSPNTTSFYYTSVFKVINVDNPPLVARETAPVQPQTVNVLQRVTRTLLEKLGDAWHQKASFCPPPQPHQSPMIARACLQRSLAQPARRSFATNLPRFAEATATLPAGVEVAPVKVKRPIGGLRGGIFGFLLGFSLASAYASYHLLEEYQAASAQLQASVEELQASTRKVSSHVRRIEEVEKDLKALADSTAGKEDVQRVRGEMKKLVDGLHIEFLDLRSHVWGMQQDLHSVIKKENSTQRA